MSDKARLMELLMRVDGVSIGTASVEKIADHLISNGITFADKNVYAMEHNLIANQLIWECPDSRKSDLLMYIAGINDAIQLVAESKT